jgi:hypothetical protein
VVAPVMLAVPVDALAVSVVFPDPSITFNVALMMLYKSQLPESVGAAGILKWNSSSRVRVRPPT